MEILAMSAVLQESTGGLLPWLEELIELAALLIEVLAVAIIIIATVAATIVYIRRLINRKAGLPGYEQYKVRLGRALLLGLEILVAADIVRTVALEPSLTNVGILALLVIIRTFLSWSLVVEIEHRWPWQRRTEEHLEAAQAHERGKTPRLRYDLYNWDFQGGLYLNGTGAAKRVEAIKHCINLQKHHSFLFLLTLNVRHTLGHELSTYLAGERGDVDLKQKKLILDWYKAQGSKSSSERFRLKVVVPLFIRKVAEVASFDCFCYPAIYYQGPSEHLLHFVFRLTAQASALPVHSKQSRSEVLELPLLEVSDGKFDLAKMQHPGHNPVESCKLLSSLGFNDLLTVAQIAKLFADGNSNIDAVV